MGQQPQIKYPQPTPEEKQLQQEQVNLLRDQRDMLSKQLREQNLMAPLLFQKAGITPQYADTSAQQSERLDTIRRLAEVGGLPDYRGDESDPAFKEAVARAQQTPEGQDLLKKIQGLDQRILSPEIVGYQEQPNPLEAQSKEIQGRLNERTLAALKGQLPVNPALLTQLGQEQTYLNDVFRKQLGPGFETSTPYLEAMGKFQKNRSDILEGSRRGDLTMAEALSLARDQNAQNRQNQYLAQLTGINQLPFGTANAFSGNLGGYQNVLAQMAAQRKGEFGSSVLQWQADLNDPFTWRGAQKNIQELAVAAMSTIKAKKDVAPVGHDGYSDALQKLRDTPVARWRYKGESDTRTPHIGPILETSPKEIRQDDMHINLGDYLGLTHAAVKGLDREVQGLKAAIRGKR